MKEEKEMKEVRMLKTKDIQEHLHISKTKVLELVSRPDFPALRMGKIIRIPEDLYLEWLEEHFYGKTYLPEKK